MIAYLFVMDSQQLNSQLRYQSFNVSNLSDECSLLEAHHINTISIPKSSIIVKHSVQNLTQDFQKQNASCTHQVSRGLKSNSPNFRITRQRVPVFPFPFTSFFRPNEILESHSPTSSLNLFILAFGNIVYIFFSPSFPKENTTPSPLVTPHCSPSCCENFKDQKREI